MTEVKMVTLDPETWARGFFHTNDRYLLGGHGKKCCMGFAALAFGATEDEIRHQYYWRDCKNTDLQGRDFYPSYGTRFHEVYGLNDCKDLTDEERVDQINATLERMGENFRFALGKSS
jgi:hypothetical protein